MTRPDPSARQDLTARLFASGVIAVIRMEDPEGLMRVVQAIRAGGVEAVEITMTVPGALRLLRAARDELGEEALLGVGSVTDRGMVRRAVEAGARYVVSPVFKPELVEEAHRLGCPVFPGAFTPTEALAAHEAGADGVKIFPADFMGPAFIRALRAPLPQLRLVPTGGVTPENAGDWIRAGAAAVGVGSALLDQKAIRAGDFAALTDNARRLVASVRAAQEEGR